ncbi:Predicted transcriptional regulator, contains an HTH and PUA-like domains [Propionispira arboris]|uniref:Predicted transcriptional regulator, contains an HTH and PUA-like domains n=1 Tax=Propionispira arboris TaxID=84035 RepID=A0A1H7D214_9FIRM|nr:hypothetical protein [Propionispira arboris]SEJ95963.1 Predicted transcriptional regulator, contains an HTH and PUA-like domains [Propionispira arboris]
MDVLLSIKPKYVEQILSGRKKYEFRKKIFLKPVERVYVYSSSPVKRIVGFFLYAKSIKDTPNNVWEQTKKFAGISKDDYFHYFIDKKIAYALIIERFYEFEIPLDPKQLFDDFSAPQSYKYICGDAVK